ncbi:MAG: class I SAM-dependent methyltransferase [Patescibacteria group bacterium]|jgi:SAM-dependent methyltransferase
MVNKSYRDGFMTGATSYESITARKHISLIYKLEQDILSDFFKKINSHSKTVLDFACGTGRWTMFLEKYFHKVTGLDISPKMIELAQQKCKQTNFYVDDITGDKNANLHFNDAFDVLTAFRFYKNAENELQINATRSLQKLVKKGGYFIFDLHLNTFSIMGLIACFIRITQLYKLLKINPLAVRTISLRRIRKIFKHSDFEIIDYFGMGIVPGRRNFTLLPTSTLMPFERWLSQHKILRNFCYNLLVFAQKK